MRGINHHDDWSWANVPRFGGGGAQNVQSTTQTRSDPWTGQQGYLTGSAGSPGGLQMLPGGGWSDTPPMPATQGVFPAAAQIYGDPSAYPQYFPGSTYAPMTPTQQGLIGSTVGLAQGGGPSSMGAANDALTQQLQGGTGLTQGPMAQTSGYLSNVLNPNFTNPWTSPGFGTNVQNTLASVIPATTASFASGGRADSGLAQRAATEGATSAIGNLANQFYTGQEQLQQGAAGQAASNFLNQQQNVMRSAAVAPSIDATQLQNLQAGLQAAGMSQSDAQNMLNDAVSRWNFQQTQPLSMLDWYSNLVGGTGYGSQTSAVNTQPYYSNVGANLLAGASGGASLGGLLSGGSGWGEGVGAGLGSLAAMMSDRRLKTDIHRVGTARNGFPIYSFRFKGEPEGTVRMGLMAQDVQKKRPEAVLRTPFGLAVEYDKALAPRRAA